METANPNPKKRRVVITGLGSVTPLGANLDETWSGILAGRSLAAPVRRFDASRFSAQIAYEVSDFPMKPGLVRKEDERFLNRAAGFGLQAAAEAMEQAGLTDRALDPWRTAVCLGVGLASPEPNWYDQIYLPKAFSPETLREHWRFLPEQLTSLVARLMGARAGATTIHTACASSGQALGEAYEMIAYDEADVVMTGGADSMINPFYLAGFGLLGALSKQNAAPATASRPFDLDRDGFVLGEGAACLVFESEASAKARGAPILAEVCGYGVTESAYRITDLHPEGIGPIEAMQLALDDAGLEPKDVAYINAHGTSTQLNDRIEALAVSKVFGFGEHSPLVSSTKSMTGHMISAAGAAEFLFCVKALMDQVLPPSIHVFNPDPDCFVKLTPARAESASVRYALSNSVGFGGSNTALIAGLARS